MNLISVNNLKYKYPSSNEFVLDISNFEVQKTEKIFLFGPSGCGKTTFLETLAGVIKPLSGEIFIDNVDIVKLSSSEGDHFRANQIGYIFQSFNLIPYLSVLENITLPLYFSKDKRLNVKYENEIELAMQYCEKLGILNLVEKNVTELSVGQQQRVAAARAMIGGSKLLLADEPTSSLDFNHREKFIKLLFDLCNEQKTTLIFVSHDKTLEQLFDRSVSLLDLNRASRNATENREGNTL